MTNEETNKIDVLAERIEQYKTQLLEQIAYFAERHNYFLKLIDETGMNDPEADPVLLGPGMLAKVERWYALTRVEAYNIAGKSRDLQKFYLAVAEQAKANQYELVRLGKYNKDMHTSTDAKEIARRFGGRLEERASYWEGEYLRWSGMADAYEQAGNSVKDLFKLAEYEWQLAKRNT